MAARASASACRGSTSSTGMEPGVEARIREAVAALEAAGATIEEVEPAAHRLRPRDLLHRRAGRGVGEPRPLRRRPLRPLASAAGGDFIADYLATRGEGFGAEVKRRIMLGTYALSAGYYDAYYLKAQKVRTLIKRDFDDAVRAGLRRARRADLARRSRSGSARGLADPVAMYLSDACTLPVNMAGLPGLSVPCGLSEGLPVGLQFIGAAVVRAASCSALGARLRGDHRRRRLARRIEPRRARAQPTGPGDADAAARPRGRRPAQRPDARLAPMTDSSADRARRSPSARSRSASAPCRRRASAGSSTSSRR